MVEGQDLPYGFKHFYEEVNNFGNKYHPETPYHYGSYQIFQANKELQKYKFINYVNTTSAGVTAHYPQFMYESILKVATGNPDFEFKVRNTPYPVTQETKNMVATSDAGSILFMAGIAYSLLCVSVVSYLVIERTTNLKHIQVTSGMQTSAYWVGNFIFDTLKFMPTILITFAIFKIYELEYPATLNMFFLFPFALLPFTYVTSFLFTVDSSAQSFTMFLHFFAITVLSTLIVLIRFANKLEHYGDAMEFWSKLIPSSVIPSTMYAESGGDLLI